MQSTVRIQYVDALLGSDHSKINNKEDKRREREREREEKEKERERKRKKEKERERKRNSNITTREYISANVVFENTAHRTHSPTHNLIQASEVLEVGRS